MRLFSKGVNTFADKVFYWESKERSRLTFGFDQYLEPRYSKQTKYGKVVVWPSE